MNEEKRRKEAVDWLVKAADAVRGLYWGHGIPNEILEALRVIDPLWENAPWPPIH